MLNFFYFFKFIFDINFVLGINIAREINAHTQSPFPLREYKVTTNKDKMEFSKTICITILWKDHQPATRNLVEDTKYLKLGHNQIGIRFKNAFCCWMHCSMHHCKLLNVPQGLISWVYIYKVRISLSLLDKRQANKPSIWVCVDLLCFLIYVVSDLKCDLHMHLEIALFFSFKLFLVFLSFLWSKIENLGTRLFCVIRYSYLVRFK